MRRDLPIWRSMLFVPADNHRFVEKAHLRGADAIVLDLEDGVHPSNKVQARRRLLDSLRHLAGGGAEVDLVVRVNSAWRLLVRDLEAVVNSAADLTVRAICIPKVNDAATLKTVSDIVTELEHEHDLPDGAIQLIALIESATALFNLHEIAHSTPRLIGMSIGSEDLSADLDVNPSREVLFYPSQQIVFAARSAGILPLGFIDSIADYSDSDAFRETIRRSYQIGLRGGFCIHPSQVKIMNEEYSPSQSDVETAESVIASHRMALANNKGATALDEKMIDAPVVDRAREILNVNRRIRQKNTE